MRALLVMLMGAGMALAQQPNTLTPKEIAEGWVLLFDGESLFGWTAEGAAKWRVDNGTVIADEGGYGWLRSNASFGDYTLRCDFRTAADGNSGIFLRSAKEGQPHLTGYELQIYDQHKEFPTGSIVGHVRGGAAAIRPGQWQTYEVTHRGDQLEVTLDGKRVLAWKDSKSAMGHVGLQFNPGKKIEFRNVKLKPLGLQAIFDGKSLAGWRVVKHARAKEDAVWSVRDGMIHVEKGPGQLETEAEWQDVVMQLEIRANAASAEHHPNSGVFLRGEANKSWSGYEIQIRNEYKDGDRGKAVDFGTGGVYGEQPARRVVANDREFFTETIVLRGRHFSVWVNGYPVSDWEDPNPEGAVRQRGKQAKLAGGVISLQAHDPTTNLDFRGLRVGR